jgi:hypothetical protein
MRVEYIVQDTIAMLSRAARQPALKASPVPFVPRIVWTIPDPNDPGWIPTRGATPSTALVPQEKAGFPIPNPRLLLGFPGTKTARREGISSPFSDAGGCTSCRK